MLNCIIIALRHIVKGIIAFVRIFVTTGIKYQVVGKNSFFAITAKRSPQNFNKEYIWDLDKYIWSNNYKTIIVAKRSAWPANMAITNQDMGDAIVSWQSKNGVQKIIHTELKDRTKTWIRYKYIAAAQHITNKTNHCSNQDTPSDARTLDRGGWGELMGMKRKIDVSVSTPGKHITDNIKQTNYLPRHKIPELCQCIATSKKRGSSSCWG